MAVASLQMAALLRVILERAEFWHLQPLTNLIAEKDPRSFPVRGFSLYYSTFPYYMPGIVKVVAVFAGVKIILGPYRDCNHSACFPGPNKCFQQDQLGINLFPWWDCSSCVHKTANRDRQPLFLPLRPTAWKASRNPKRSLAPASCPKAVSAIFQRGPYLKAAYGEGKPSKLCFFKCQI